MTETAFDTLEMVRRLETKGFTPEQAEGVTQAVRTGVTGGVATKADLAEVRADMAELRSGLTAEISRVRTDLTAEISRVRADLTAEISDVRSDLKWMKAIGAGILAVMTVAGGWIITLLHDLILALNGTTP